MMIANKQVSSQEMAKSHGMDLAASGGSSQRERYLRRALIFMGVLVLVYVYSSNLLAQQSAGQRISISQPVDFPNDI